MHAVAGGSLLFYIIGSTLDGNLFHANGECTKKNTELP